MRVRRTGGGLFGSQRRARELMRAIDTKGAVSLNATYLQMADLSQDEINLRQQSTATYKVLMSGVICKSVDR